MIRYFSSVRSRLTVLVLMAVVPALLLVVYAGLRQRHEDVAKVQENMLRLARQVARDQRRQIETARQLLTAMAQVPAVRQGDAEQCRQFLAHELQLHAVAFANFALTDADGLVTASVVPLEPGKGVVSNRVWFVECRESRDFVVGPYEALSPSGLPGVTVAVPIFWSATRFGGVLFATLDLRWLHRLARESDLPPDATITVVDHRAVVLAHYPDGERWAGSSIQHLPVIREVTQTVGQGTTEHVGLDGVPRLFGYAPMRFGNRVLNAHVLVGVPQFAAYEQANRNLLMNVAVLLTVALLALVTIHWGGTQLLVRPLNGLVGVTRRLAAGDLATRSGGPYGEGEIDELRRAFDEMAAALEKQAVQLRSTNRALRTISQCHEALVRAENEQKLLQKICEIIVASGDYRMAAVAWVEDDAAKTMRPAASAGHTNGDQDEIKVFGETELQGHSPTATAARTGEYKLVRNIASNASFALSRELALKRGYTAALALPLRGSMRTFAVLTIYSSEPDAFDPEEVSLLTALANDLAYGLTSLRNQAERERVEQQQMQASEQRLRSVIESSPMGMHLYELREDGQLVFSGANPAANRILGFDNQTLLGKPIEEAFPGLAGTEIPDRYREVCRTGQPWQTEQIAYKDERVNGVFEVHAFGTGPNRMAAMFFDITERRHAQIALEQSERRFRELFEASPDAIFVGNLDGRILDVNPAACELHRLDRASLIGKQIFDLVPPDAREQVRRDFVKLANGEWSEITGESLRADGQKVPVEIRARKMEYAGQTVLLLHVRDITARRDAERVLRESEERYRAVIEQSGDGIYMVDIATKEVVDANPAFWRILGYQETPVGLKVYDVVADDRAKVDERIDSVARGGRTLQMERRYRRRDGTLIDVLVTASQLRYSGRTLVCTSVHDITERKRAEETRLRLATAVEQAAEGIMITDANGTIQYVNPALELLTGYKREELVGQNPRIFKSGKHEADYYREVWETLSRGEVWRGFFFNRKKDGSIYQEENMISPIRDSSGRISSYVAVKRDVTREIALEIQLLQSQKMEAIGRLAGGLAHDFNNILTAITGYAELGLTRLGPDDPQRRTLDEILKSASRASALTRQLLAFGRKQVLETKVLDLNELLTNLEKMLRRLIGEDIELICELQQPVWPIKADPGQIEQVVVNLAINARDAMPLGGRLTIRTANLTVTEKRVVCQALLEPGEYVCLSVVDTGTGMSEETKAHAFEPFFTTKPSDKGTGLGLATCYGIVTQSGGYIELDSQFGVGTTFHIYLPRHRTQPAPMTTSITEPKLATSPTADKTILFVEDEEAVRKLGVLILEELGYRVYAAANGVEALQVVADQGYPKIDLLLTDVVMPQMGGRELSERMRKVDPELRILFCSGYTPQSKWVSQVLTKNTHFLQKPFTASALAHKVREILDM